MAFKRGFSVYLPGACLFGCGALSMVASQDGLWGLFTGAVLATVLLISLYRSQASSPTSAVPLAVQDAAIEDATVLKILLDYAPTPLLGVANGVVRALNRAAREMFVTDDRVLPPPPALLKPDATYFRYEARGWRIDRVEIARANRMVVALIDIEQEERSAEARATSNLIEILGHELLNGLAPIVSLAESGLAVIAKRDLSYRLLPEILGTLARRAEGLQRFTEAYRAMARLPEPLRRPVSVQEMMDDLVRLFRGRWPHIDFNDHVTCTHEVMLDRDQISQAIWAILQNSAEAVSCHKADGHVCLIGYQSNTQLQIYITDNGPGISDEHKDHIFRPFHTTKLNGTGIGLSLARQIAHAHGGTLLLSSSYPTKFHLTIPLR